MFFFEKTPLAVSNNAIIKQHLSVAAPVTTTKENHLYTAGN